MAMSSGGTQKEMRTSRENAEVVSRKNLLTLVLSALNLQLPTYLCGAGHFLEDQQMLP